ncbi:MAG TPA: GNAT family N-acetyltransferase [Solirubrobacteraceae bacterium]|nr:GNAT family N-acetyltransferase [Solirubrobacteraceae bacterium]
MGDVVIRPMRDEDVVDADRVCFDVLYTTFAGEAEAVRAARQHARIRHLLETDPGGSWVAEHDGRLAGVALALIREGVWGFSLFAVAQELQGRGVGRELFARCWEYGTSARGHLVLSSTNPQAMGIYAHSGVPIRPCVAAAGVPDLSRAPDVDGIVDAGEAGIPLADAIGRELRGAGHGRDLPVPMAHGARLLVFEDRAFALARGSNVILLGARDPQAAQHMLWGLFVTGPPGATVNVDFLTAGQDWALPVCLDARLPLSPDGPMFAGGQLGPLAPYIPSGAYL